MSPEPPCPDKPSTKKYFFCQNHWEPHYHGNMDFNSPRSRKRGQLQSWPLTWCFLAWKKIPLLRSPPYRTSPPSGQSPQIQPMSPSEGHKPEKCINTISTSFLWSFSEVFFTCHFWIIFWNWPDQLGLQSQLEGQYKKSWVIIFISIYIFKNVNLGMNLHF